MKTFYTFKNSRAFQTFLRNKEHKSGELDYITLGKHVYTMHEYDMGGRFITWANKKHEKMVEVETSDRYLNGYKDAIVRSYPAFYLRTDISYAE